MNMWAAHVLKGIAALPSKTEVCNTLQTSRWTFFKWALNQAILCLTKSKFTSLLPVQLREKTTTTQNRKPRNWIPIHMLALKVIFTPTWFFCSPGSRFVAEQIVETKTHKKHHPEKLSNHQGTRTRVWQVSWICFVYFRSFLFHAWASLRILCLASKVWVPLGMIHGSHSQLKTNKQPPTTKPDPKAPSSVFHPEFMNMQP